MVHFRCISTQHSLQNMELSSCHVSGIIVIYALKLEVHIQRFNIPYTYMYIFLIFFLKIVPEVL